MSYGQYQNNPYQSGPGAEQGYGNQGYGNPGQGNQGYGQNQHELQNYPQAPTVHVLSTQEFLPRVQHVRDEIRSLTSNIHSIQQLHQRALAETDGGNSSQALEQLVTDTQIKNTNIRDQLKSLANDAAKTTDGSKSTKERHVQSIKREFENELRSYNQEENTYRQRYQEQIARQYRIVNPDATEQEVQQAAEADWGNEGVFQTALRTNRTGQANAVLGAVRARHNELQRIEQTLMELAALFQDLATLVDQQEVAVVAAEDNAQKTTTYIEQGNEHVSKGIKSARNRRKWKWWCLLVTILIIIAIALGVYFGIQAQNAAKNAATP